VKSATYYIKAGLFSLLIFIESFILAQLIIGFVRNQDIFSVDLRYSAMVVAMMLLITYTFALTIGGWQKWEQYLIIIAPVILAVFLSTFPISPTYAVVITFGFGVLLSFDVYKSTRLKNLLLKPEPKMILRFSTRGLLFLFSVLGGVLVTLNVSAAEPLNIGQKVGEMTSGPIQTMLEGQIPQEAQDLVEGTIDYREVVETQVNALIEPYRNLVNPVIAILTFALFQVYASVAYLIYIITIDGIFWLAKKLKLFTVEKVMVEQEQLKF
jgi:hypothetical protein